jgi:DNA-binding protein YbaB
MFDSFRNPLKNLGAMAGIMKDLPRIKARMEEARSQAEATRVAATAGHGAVTVVASGRMRIESIAIEPALFAAYAPHGDAGDRAIASDLVREAVNAALEAAQARAAEILGEAARDLDLPISTEDLKGFL